MLSKKDVVKKLLKIGSCHLSCMKEEEKPEEDQFWMTVLEDGGRVPRMMLRVKLHFWKHTELSALGYYQSSITYKFALNLSSS